MGEGDKEKTPTLGVSIELPTHIMDSLMAFMEATNAEISGLKKRNDVLETIVIEAVTRKDSLDIQTAAKGGNFKHYLNPLAPVHDNDMALAEEARNFMNSGGILPEGFSPRIRALAELLEAKAAEWPVEPKVG